MTAEWDAWLKTRELTDADIDKVSQQMPRRVKKTRDRRGERILESLHIAGARGCCAMAGAAATRHLAKLSTYRKLDDGNAGLIRWMLAPGDVLLWWCDRRCLACGGMNLMKGKTGKACYGFGSRDVPHGSERLRISEHIVHALQAFLVVSALAPANACKFRRCLG